jgi:DNA-binding MarR family transcriptional regulator
LSALLSQVLVAFTLEFDNEFERRMGEAGCPGMLLSLGVWSNVLRFLAAGGLSVSDLAAQALAPKKRIEFELGCLERWGVVVLRADPAHGIRRDGWGSGRGICSSWIVSLTEKGRAAAGVWPPLFAEIERRWQVRFGDDEIAHLRQALEGVVKRLDLELPGPLPSLLSDLLLAYTVEFDRESTAPLILCANTLRVLGEAPIPASEIPRLTGGSPETSGIGWQMKPYVVVERDPHAARGKVARLTPAGLKAQRRYRELSEEIEQRWEARFGKDKIRRLRECLRELFVPRLSEGLVPAPGTVRSGAQRPALGRRDVGAAARQRMRDMVAQTELFVRDPANSLPHYPMWDMNRGFGP